MKSSKHEKEGLEPAGNETIAAIITPPGEGGLGAIRISGCKAHAVFAGIFAPHDKNFNPKKMFHLAYGHIIDRNGIIIDEVTGVMMPEGQSFTGQAQAEIFCHGGRYVLSRILNEIFQHDVRPAEPGEFTRRAFLAGRIDLARAEAVADLVASQTEYAYQIAKAGLLGKFSEHIDSIRRDLVAVLAEIEASLDYPEEAIELSEKTSLLNKADSVISTIEELIASYEGGRIIKDGYRVAIAGRPNAGKSSLFNLFLNQDRAIVTPTPGTTRDYINEWIDIDGYAVQLSDMAGLREKAGKIERAGQLAAAELIRNSDLTIWLIDTAQQNWKKLLVADIKAYLEKTSYILAVNKTDRIKTDELTVIVKDINKIANEFELISCKTRSGYTSLRKRIIENISINIPDLTDRMVLTSHRHRKKLQMALKELKQARKNIKMSVTPELTALNIRTAISEIDELTGKIYNEDILKEIFSRFCIGK